MPPNPKTGLVTLPKVVTGDLAGKFGEILLYNQHATSSLDPTPTRTRPYRGPLHASRLSSHRVRTPHSMSTSHTASASLARPTRRLFPHAGLGRRSSPSTTQTPTPSPATTRTPTPSPVTTRTPPTNSTSGRTLTSTSPRPTRRSNRCQDLPPAWL
jgi:hypothetical protein